ncbi:probable gluconokinase isoform X1 [Bos indicus x Bos taurus]|uniref:Gluconokinase n=3 Tax=Bovinae TaxID=27592 RepID=A0A4W2DB18_BOBOX|nr:probable gluconokinase isoform X1 [Bos indicus x Bos taurus]
MKKTAAATQWAGLVKHPYRPPCSCTWVEEGWSVWLLVGKRVARLFLHLLLVLGTHSAHHMGRMTCCVPSFTLFLKLGWKFYDADDYHPEENRMKMQKGIPLNDEDRIPWLCKLHDVLRRDVASGQHVVLACSALKKVYRDILIQGKDDAPLKCDDSGKEEKPVEVKLLVVHLTGSFDIISGRLLRRKDHFMPPELLQSQFDTLETPSAPESFIQINVDKNLSEIIATIMETLK